MARRPAEVARAKSCKTVNSFCQHGSQWSLLYVIDECKSVADSLLGSDVHWRTLTNTQQHLLSLHYNEEISVVPCFKDIFVFLKAIQVHTLRWLNQSQRGLWKQPVSGVSTFAGLLPSMVSIRVMGLHCTAFAMATHPVLWCFETEHSFFLLHLGSIPGL